MATMPQDNMMGGDSADQDQEDSGDGGFCIEIHVAADGSIKVGVEPEAEEAQEESAEGGSEDDDEYQPVANVREALKLVKEIIDSRGQMPDAGADQAAMNAGYGE